MHSITIAYANYLKKESEMKTNKKSNFILATFIPDDIFFIKIETKHLYTVRLVKNLEEAQESV